MKRFWKNSIWYVLLCIGLLLILMIIFRQYIFDGYYMFSKGLWSDLLRANLPTYYQMYDCMASGGYFWSWNMGLGTSMFSHADCYFDPFTYIVFLFGRDNIPNMMLWLFIIKIICEGCSFFAYINYFKIDKKAGFLAAIMYALTGYSLIMGNNFVLGTIMVYMPLVFLGIEKWLDSNKISILAIFLFMTCIYSYYFFYCLGLLTVIYTTIRAYQKKQKIIPRLFHLFIIAIVVVLMSSFTILPQIQLVLNSPRVAGTKDVSMGLELWIPQMKVLITAMVRAISNDIFSNPLTGNYNGTAYFGTRDYFQISTYINSVFYILAIQYWHNEKERRKKIAWITCIVSLMIVCPIFSFVFNAFSTINSRWMFIISLLESLLTAYALDSIFKRGGLHFKSLIVGIIVSLLVVICGMACMSIGTQDFAEQFQMYFYNGRRFIIALLLVYLILLGIYRLQHFSNKKYIKIIIYLLVIGIVAFDAGINYYHCYAIDESVSQYSEEERTTYQDTSATMINEIKMQDNSFYRINKTFDSVVDDIQIPSCNDAMAQQYYGLKCYNSLNNTNYITFLQTLGIYVAVEPSVPSYISAGVEPKEIVGSQLNYINGVYDRYRLMNYLGVKYLIIDDGQMILPDNFQYITQQNGKILYENNDCYPLAFVNQRLMSLKEFETLSDEDKEYAILQYTILDNDEWYNTSLIRDEHTLHSLAQERQNAFQLINFSEDEVDFRIEVPKNAQYLSFSMPYDKDWHVYVDGKEVSTYKINISLLGAEISEGNHVIKLSYEPMSVKIGLIATVVGMFLLIILWNFSKQIYKNINNIYSKLVQLIKKITKQIKSLIIFKVLLKAIGCILAAYSIVFVSVFVFYPSAFVKSEVVEFRDFSQIMQVGYNITENHFTVTQDDPQIVWMNECEHPISYIDVQFQAIENTNSGQGLLTKIYYNNGNEEYTEEKSVCQYATPDNLYIHLPIDCSEIQNIRLDLGELKGEDFSLESIQITSQYFSADMEILCWIAIGAIPVFLFMFFFFSNRRVKEEKINRESNVELCRIICMLLIIAHHLVIHGGAYDMPEMTGNRIFSLFLIPGGKLCFDCFVAISCWFLVDQQFKMKRFLKVWFMVLFYSICFSAVAVLMGTKFNMINWISVCLPITGNSHGFASAYLAFYLLLPFLTKISSQLSKKQARWLMMLLLYFEVISQIIGCFISYYQKLSSELLLFVLCYFIALNFKKWPFKICDNKKVMLSIFVIIWIGLWFVRYLYVHNPNDIILRFIMSTMCDESSITNLVGGFALFFFFKNLKLNSNYWINYLATGTFAVLLFHDHNFFRYVLWKNILKTEVWYHIFYFPLLVVAVVIWVYAVGFILEKIRCVLIERKLFANRRLNKWFDKVDAVLNHKQN